MSGRGQQGGAGPGAIVTGRGGGSYTFENITWQDTLAAIWWMGVVWLGIRGGWCFVVWLMIMCVGPQAGGILAFGVAVAYAGFGTRNVRLQPSKYTPLFLMAAAFFIFLATFDYWPAKLTWAWIDHQMYWSVTQTQLPVAIAILAAGFMIFGVGVILYKLSKQVSVLLSFTLVSIIGAVVALVCSDWFGWQPIVLWQDAGWIAAESSAVILRFFGGFVMLILAWIPAQQMDTALRTEMWLPGLRESAKTVPATAESVPGVGDWGLTSASKAARTETVDDGPDVDFIPPLSQRGNTGA